MNQEQLLALQEEIETFEADENFPHDPYVLITLQEAATAGLEGNAGVGALLVGPDGEVAHRDRNRMFHPYFRSDYHAEMVLLTAFEEQIKGAHTLKGYSLYSSLEPCEMCMIRIINAGVSNVYYAGIDAGKGAVNGPHRLADHWRDLAEKQNIAQANCSPRLAEIGLEIFLATIADVRRKLHERR
ncbi:MAG TPA: deaminase [Candidatus Sulfomarinibacteraceae bacterium]|nr:deaminase [Candidatus Sulfomarinibacteraceae bacterium]